jgi:hypothetical protein
MEAPSFDAPIVPSHSEISKLDKKLQKTTKLPFSDEGA